MLLICMCVWICTACIIYEEIICKMKLQSSCFDIINNNIIKTLISETFWICFINFSYMFILIC